MRQSVVSVHRQSGFRGQSEMRATFGNLVRRTRPTGTCLRIAFAVVLLLGPGLLAQAGMPGTLPTYWTAENHGGLGGGNSVDRLFQGISFFGACFLVSAAGIRWMWNYLRRDIRSLPHLSYGRAVAITGLWGFLFVIVLTMISGARELMTPRAWQKQGWTYSLDKLPDTSAENSSATARRAALEQLRFQLWNYAATHNGQFPAAANVTPGSDTSTGSATDEPASDVIPSSSWDVPGWPGLKFLYVDGQTAGDAGSVLVFEPSLEADQRLVLLTNGVVGTIPVEELKRFLRTRPTELESADLSPAKPDGDQP
jgi:hypothetical protein